MSDLSCVVIEEVAGQKRSLELRGAGLPHQGGARWGSLLQLKTVWYSGNPEATQQVLGPRDPPSTMEGTWRRTRLSRTPCIVTVGGSTFRVVNPLELVTTVETIQRAGARLRVTWQGQTPDGQATEIAREGRLASFEYVPDRVTDVGWTMNFEWVGRGASTQRVASTRDGGAASAKDALESVLTDFNGALSEAHVTTVAPERSLKGPTAFTLGQLEAFANAPLALVESVTTELRQATTTLSRIGDIAATIRDQPFAIANACVDVARNTVAVANAFADKLSGQPPELQSLKSDAPSVIRAASAFGQTIDAQRRLTRKAQEIADKTSLIVTRNPGGPGNSNRATGGLRAGALIAVHITRRGDTPQRLSRRYYKTPDLAVEILRANALPWNTTTFDVGKTLIIVEPPTKKGA